MLATQLSTTFSPSNKASSMIKRATDQLVTAARKAATQAQTADLESLDFTKLSHAVTCISLKTADRSTDVIPRSGVQGQAGQPNGQDLRA